jgi:hypothetical protein
VRRETKYTLAGFAVFLYSLGLMALLMMSFVCTAGPSGKAIAVFLTAFAAALWALMVHFHPRGVRFRYRALLLLLTSTIADLLIWFMICEGTFVPLA